MCDGSRKPACGRQFFRFPQRILGPLALGGFDDDRSHPSNRLRRSLDRIHIDEPTARLRDIPGQGRIQLKLGHRFPGFKDILDAALQHLGGWAGEHFIDGAPQVPAYRHVVHLGQKLVHAHVAKLAIEESEPNGRVFQHGVEQRQGIAEPGSLLLHGGHHQVEGAGKVRRFVGGGHFQRKSFFGLRVTNQLARGREQCPQRAGDGTGQSAGNDGRAQSPQAGEDDGDADERVNLLPCRTRIFVYPGEAAELTTHVDRQDGFTGPARHTKNHRTGSIRQMLLFQTRQQILAVHVRDRCWR